jgi:hypothetical protein
MLKNLLRSKKSVTFLLTGNSPCASRAAANQEIGFSSLARRNGLAAKAATGSEIDPPSAAKRQSVLRTSWIAQLLLRDVLFGVASLALKELPAEPGSGDIMIVSRHHFIWQSYRSMA